MSFSVQVNTMPGELVVHLDGALDEHGELPKVSAAPAIRVNLDKLLYINSIGVRKWIRWMQELADAGVIYLEYCPVILIKSICSIKGMLGPNVRIESFYVPYYNEISDERKNVLFVRGTHFFDDGRITPPPPQGLEMDVIEDIYFSFLKK